MTEDKHQLLKQWIETLDGNAKTEIFAAISESLVVTDNKLLGRGIEAKDEIAKKTTVIKIPKKLLLNYVTVLKFISPWNSQVDKFLSKNISNYRNAMFQTSSDQITEIYTKLSFEELIRLTSHQILSLFLLLERKRELNSWWKKFVDCLPELEAYDNIPMTWNLKCASTADQKLFKNLPKSVILHSEKQLKQFNSDFTKIASLLLPLGVKIIEKEFLWAWMAVNTRCLYFKLPSYLPLFHNQYADTSNITMVPFVDYINHLSDYYNAEAKFTKSGYEVNTTDSIQKNDYLWFSYGPHSDLVLQCEYGFSLSQVKYMDDRVGCTSLNPYNTIDITEIITKLLKNPKKKNALNWIKQSGYFEDYTLGFESSSEPGSVDFEIKTVPSYRTRVAIAVLIEKEEDFKFNKEQNSYMCPLKLEQFYQGYTEGEYYSKTEQFLLKKILAKLKIDLSTKLNKLKLIKESPKLKVVQNLLLSELLLIESLK